MPWTRRIAMSTSTDGATMQTSAEAVNTTSPASRVGRRPRPSLTGPAISWPSPSPMRKVVTLSATADSDAPRASAAAGIAGRKRSVANDPRVQRPPKMRMMSARRRGVGAEG